MYLVTRFRECVDELRDLGAWPKAAITLVMAVTLGGHAITVVQRTMLKSSRVIEVRFNDTAATCYPPLQKRSSEPRFGGDFCGLIFTAEGYYKLPDTRLWHVREAPRFRLHEALERGCRYDVTVVPAGRMMQEITDINRVLGCGSSIEI